jgi:hypothetical protein
MKRKFRVREASNWLGWGRMSLVSRLAQPAVGTLSHTLPQAANERGRGSFRELPRPLS